MKTRSASLFLLLLVFSHPLFAAITGTVMDRDGKAIAGAKVSAYAPSVSGASRARYLSDNVQRTVLASAQSDAKGAFSLDTPKDQPVVVLQVDAKGFAPLGRSAERDEELGALPLSKAELREGRITAAGKPVANAAAIFTGNSSEVIAITNAEGRYSVPDPSKWANSLSVVSPNAALFQELLVMNPNATKNLDRALVSGAPISGTVVGADGKTPAAKATIFVDGWPLGVSGDDGTFTMTRTPKSWETLEARSGSLSGIRSRPSNPKDAVTLRLAKPATVTGILLDGKTQAPIAGAVVSLMRAGRFGGDSTTALTNAKGAYTLTPVAAGHYSVAASHPAYTVTSVNAIVTEGQTILRNLVGARDPRISGVVMDEDKRPVAAAALRVEAAADGGGMQMQMMRVTRGPMDVAYSGPDGRFVARASGEGDFNVMGSRKGLPSGKAGPIALAAGDRKTGVLVTIPRGVAVAGRVTDRDGKPLSGASVSAVPAEAGPGGAMMMRRVMIGGRSGSDEDVVRTNSDGSFSMQLKPGNYDFDVRREGFAPKLVRAVTAGSDAKLVEVTLDPGVEITGRVTRGGVGVEGVNVSAMATGGNVVTAPDGSFTISDLAPGSTMLNFSRFEDGIREMRTVNAPLRDLLIEVPAGGRVNGRVIDKATNQPITAFQAGVSNSRSAGGFVMMAPPSLRSFTTADGTFTLENVPPGPVEVVVQAPGYTTGRTANLQMEEGKTLNDVVVSLDTGVRITGKVTGPDGGAIAGVQVSAANGGSGPRMMMMNGDPASSTVTDSSGEYVLEAQEPGERILQFAHQKYLPASKPVELSGREARVDMQLSSGSKISGVVVTESGTPVAEAMVRASSGAGNVFGRSVVTDANGNFSMESLTPGRYTFNAQKRGHADGVLRDFDISSGAPIRITMKAGATIFGRVSGLSEADLQNVTVDARGPEGGGSAAVDASGNYTIEGAPTGTVRVSAALMRSFNGRRTTAVKSLNVAQGAREQVDLEFKSDTVIRGRVTRNGKPLNNAQIMFYPRDVRSQTTSSVASDESGNYTIEGLEDGEYSVQVMDMQRYSPYRTTYKVNGSSTFDIDMKVTVLQGRVTDASTGAPLQNARVQLRGATDDSPFAQGAETDSAGAFTLGSVAPGRYHASAEKEGYGAKVIDVTVTESAEPLELKLARQPGLTLRVVDARDNRLLNASVIVSDTRGAVVYNDSFRFNTTSEPLKLPLDAGQYSVTVAAMGYATRTFPMSSPGTQTIGLTPGGTLVIRSKSDTRQRARLVDASGTIYYRFPTRGDASFMVDVRGLETTLRNIAPGTYMLQLLGNGDAVQSSVSVTVMEGQVTATEL